MMNFTFSVTLSFTSISDYSTLCTQRCFKTNVLSSFQALLWGKQQTGTQL